MALQITDIPDPPLVTDSRPDFNAKAFAAFGMLPDFADQANALANEAESNAAAAETAMDSASDFADDAAASAASAVLAPGTSATSTSNNTVGTGNKPFAIQVGKNFVKGQRVTAARTAAPGNAMHGYIDSYDAVTGALVIVVDSVTGAGTFTDWTIGLSGATGTVTGAGFTPSLDTSSPNGTVSVALLTATGAQTNIDIALAPKGTGAVLADLPDSASTGGNKRGTNAVDLQTVRAAAAQVASGQSSVVVGGERNTASSTFDVVVGGYGNTASGGAGSAVLAGNFNQATAVGSVIGGGGYNVASGIRSAILGGLLGTTRGITGAESWGAGNTIAGEYQREHFTQIALTGGNPAAGWVLTSAGGFPDSSNVMVMPNNSAYKIEGQLVARQYSGSSGTVGDTATFFFRGTFTRGANAASTAVLDSVTVTKDADSAGATAWTLTLTADTTLGAPVLTFTGAANKNIAVVAEIRTVEVTT